MHHKWAVRVCQRLLNHCAFASVLHGLGLLVVQRCTATCTLFLAVVLCMPCACTTLQQPEVPG